ncbi:MAG: hypothetical protein KIPDCIKN_02401 [Haliscomenobacter sp.]|nr:hypothetical protein [Haliscomenobacter sp.]
MKLPGCRGMVSSPRPPSKGENAICFSFEMASGRALPGRRLQASSDATKCMGGEENQGKTPNFLYLGIIFIFCLIQAAKPFLPASPQKRRESTQAKTCDRARPRQGMHTRQTQIPGGIVSALCRQNAGGVHAVCPAPDGGGRHAPGRVREGL